MKTIFCVLSRQLLLLMKSAQMRSFFWSVFGHFSHNERLQIFTIVLEKAFLKMLENSLKDIHDKVAQYMSLNLAVTGFISYFTTEFFQSFQNNHSLEI